MTFEEAGKLISEARQRRDKAVKAITDAYEREERRILDGVTGPVPRQEPYVGVEPTTKRLRGSCSAIELVGQMGEEGL